MKKIKVYLAITADKFELPLCIFDSRKDLAKWANRDTESLSRSIRNNTIDRKIKCRYIKIEIVVN